MKKDTDTVQNKVSRWDDIACADALLETLLAAFPMEGDRQQAEQSLKRFVADEEKK